jgi:hypothetical protein
VISTIAAAMRHTLPSQGWQRASIPTIPFSQFLDQAMELPTQLCQLTYQRTVIRQSMDMYLNQVNRIGDATTRIHRMLALITATP